MKHGLSLLLLFASLSTQAAQLTFRVNMQGQTVAASGVHVAGSFQSEAGFPADWNPATTQLTDADNDKIYEVTVNVPAGVYQYKFVNGNAWSGAEQVSATCGVADGGGNVNRQLTLGTSSFRQPAIPFGGCLTQVKFSVNMQGQTVSANGVHVAGNFQALAGYGTDWDATTIPLADPEADGIYEALVSLPAAGRFQYKFINGTAWAGAEAVPGTCGTDDSNGGFNRILDATADVNTLPAVCFGSCTPCGNVAPSTNYSTYWWNDAVFYEIFVRSFYDTNRDGKGDFKGLTAKLDYLNDGNPATTTDLGITGIWLMPMMESPSYHGYDITNYLATEPDYGTMADFEEFLAAAHARGIKVIIDLVLNHSSSQHPWFLQSASSSTNSYNPWYRWSATDPGYQGPLGQAWHARNGAFFYGVFGNNMPDLNWNNPDLKAAMWDVTRFWLGKGVDGYRLDAVKYLNESGTTLENAPQTLTTLEEFGQVVRAAKPDAYTVGEAWGPTPQVVPYVTNGRLDNCFEFDLAAAIIGAVNSGNPAGLNTKLSQVANAYPKLQYATFLTNHDQIRVLDAVGGNVARQRQAAALYLTMPGVPFLYYGEELGMRGGATGDEEKRKPMQWTDGAAAGFSEGTPWSSPGANFQAANVAAEQTDANSLLSHYKKLIALRNSHEVLRKGYFLPVSTTAAGVTSYGRVLGNAATIVIANLSTNSVASPAVSVAISTLEAGTYTATDLYSGQAAGTVTVDTQGAFSNWTSSLSTLTANQTWIIQLSKTQVGTATRQAGQLALSLFPNPATSQVQVEVANPPAGSSQLAVYDLTGRRLYTASFTGRRHVLDTNRWAEGTYFVRIQSGTAVSTQRLVITR
jgi:alpha-amylase